MSYIIAIDQGTTGTTAALISAENFEFIGKVNEEFPQIFPEPGWVEHNLNHIWKTVESTVGQLLHNYNIKTDDIKAIGITNQRETTCAFDTNGTPLANAIVWQDRRTTEFCEKLRQNGNAENIHKITGLTTDPYFSATKMHWLLNNNSNVQNAAKDGTLHLGTIDTFLLYKLTSGNCFKTDATNASRTLLYNLESNQYDEQLLKLFEIKNEYLPSIENSIGEFGKTSGLNFLPNGIPITGILGDQQAALFGQAGVNKGDIKCTYGTGAFILLNTGEEISYSQSGLLTTLAYRKDNKSYYALEGSTYIAGAAVQWLRDNLKIINTSSDVEALANQVKDLTTMKNILFFPFFTGIGSPYWKSNAQAAITGLTRDTSNSHIARACLEGVALSINDLIDAMEKDMGEKLKRLNVDGGAVANNLLMSMQAHISQLDIVRPKVIETTSYGAALAAAIGADLISINNMSKYWNEERIFKVEDESTTNYFNTKKSQWTKTINKLF